MKPVVNLIDSSCRSVTYAVDGTWKAVVYPEGLEVFALPGADPDTLAKGVQASHLRAIPVRDARILLIQRDLEDRGGQWLAAIPSSYGTDSDFRILATMVGNLSALGLPNTVAAIVRAKGGNRGTWHKRIQRALATSAE